MHALLNEDVFDEDEVPALINRALEPSAEHFVPEGYSEILDG